ncbi:hypothetical protein [Paracoccus sp. NSM]|uniref:hypothetical protein n=1 Tax=Paracoccus sp. NSM TaxID=3457784 RepID=UPI0040355355
MQHSFNGIRYKTRADMLAGFAHDFMTGGGLHSPDQVAHLLAHLTDAEAAAEAFDNWDLGDMTHAEVEAAIAQFRADRPDMKG